MGSVTGQSQASSTAPQPPKIEVYAFYTVDWQTLVIA